MAYSFKTQIFKNQNKKYLMTYMNPLEKAIDDADYMISQFGDILDMQQRDEIFMDIRMWLITDVNQCENATNSIWTKLNNMIFIHKDKITSTNFTNLDGIGGLLVEILRCVNFATHEKCHIKNYAELMTAVKLEIKGEYQRCLELTTFSVLDYSQGTVNMIP